VGVRDEKAKSDQPPRVSGPSREFAESRPTAAAEITRNRNQKAESAEKEGRKRFRAHEIMMVRP